jgi:hypothetical protein
MIKIDLKNKRNFKERRDLNRELFDMIMSFGDRRNDRTSRTGFISLQRELYTGNENLCIESAYAPPPKAIYLVSAKSSRTENRDEVTSQDSEAPPEHWRGCISYLKYGQIFHSSTSGLLGSEDVVVSIIKMARALKITINEVIKNIEDRKGALPEEIYDHTHYLYEILQEYRNKELD